MPSSLATAARLMYIGGGLSALGTIIGLATVHELQLIVAQQHPAMARAAVGAAVAILLIHGVIGTALWLWLAREAGRGLRRARAWATALFCIATVSGIGIDAHAPSTGLTQAFSGIEWVIGLCAVVLLWNRPSRSYYAAQRPPVSYPVPSAPSPSLSAAPGPARPADEHPAAAVAARSRAARPSPAEAYEPVCRLRSARDHSRGARGGFSSAGSALAWPCKPDSRCSPSSRRVSPRSCGHPSGRGHV